MRRPTWLCRKLPTRTASLRSGALALLLGNGALHACRLAAVVLIAKQTTPEILGQFETGMAIAAPVVLFFTLELRAVLVADPREAAPLAEYRVIRNTGLLAASAILSVVIFWRSRFDSAALLAILAAAFALRLALQAAELNWGHYQRQYRLDRLGLSNALRGGAMLLIFATVLLPSWPGTRVDSREWFAALAIGLSALAWVAVSVFFDRPRIGLDCSRDAGALQWHEIRKIVHNALPLTLVALLIALCDSIPRLLVRGQADGLRQLGHYGAIAYLPMAAHFVILQIGLAASRSLVLGFESDRARFWKLVRQLTTSALLLGGLVLVIVIIAGHSILRIAYDAQYALHQDALVTLTLAHCCLLFASVWGYVLTQMRAFWIQLYLHIVVTLATLIAGCWWIPRDPISGAASTMLARGALHAALYGGALVFVRMRVKSRTIV